MHFFNIILPLVITNGNKKGVEKMSVNKNHVNKEIIIEATLKLIDDNEGIKNVTLRDIAKKIGCAHTNLYNYYGSLDEIFWESLAQALVRMMDYSAKDTSNDIKHDENFYLVLSNLIDFSTKHRGWFKLIWLESIGGNPSPEVIKILNTPGRDFVELIIESSNNTLSEQKASMIGDILHNYLHGELCKWLNNRVSINNMEEAKIKILSNLKYLYKVLIRDVD